ncbi:flagellar biosynthesis anti-sigma factor FlgM [Sulfurimonas sp. SAG-AH-194-I05]|nr:flagellar biosynthesis anti-sigma factor FlgM [Sulfurimonas sp. SAG-AH-194-I05]MDF1874312.1 flagellar biosynthesis anti-sigma factor FlgM [Sulfurimonas sp. SAG-AH-194-I05]
MISQVNSPAIRNAYTNNLPDSKEASKKAGTNISSQGDTSKVEQIKVALEAGEYKINLQALSEKIADELL